MSVGFWPSNHDKRGYNWETEMRVPQIYPLKSQGNVNSGSDGDLLGKAIQSSYTISKINLILKVPIPWIFIPATPFFYQLHAQLDL
jgi:hypothetical protein